MSEGRGVDPKTGDLIATSDEESGERRGSAGRVGGLLGHALHALAQLRHELTEVQTGLFSLGAESGQVLHVPESEYGIEHVAQELLQSVNALARDAHRVSGETRDTR